MIKIEIDDNGYLIDRGDHLRSSLIVEDIPVTGHYERLWFDGEKVVKVFNTDSYKQNVISDLRTTCRKERELYFPDAVKDNLLVGMTYTNPLLTIINYKKLADYYRQIVYNNEPLIMAATTKDEIDSVINAIIFPNETTILEVIA